MVESPSAELSSSEEMMKLISVMFVLFIAIVIFASSGSDQQHSKQIIIDTQIKSAAPIDTTCPLAALLLSLFIFLSFFW